MLVVSYLANAPFSPRGERTAHVVSALEAFADVSVLSGSRGPTDVARAGKPRLVRLLGLARRRLLLDAMEPWALVKRSSTLLPSDGALLVAYPFSPVVHAARRLRKRGVPYVVDVGDPWILTARNLPLRTPALQRARRMETRLWKFASGAIVTTHEQAARLQHLFPGLDLLVRPNGTDNFPLSSEDVPPARHPKSVLKLVHFGSIDLVREDVRPFLAALGASGRWELVTFDQFGSDWANVLGVNIPGVTVSRNAPVPWSDAVKVARKYDAGVVIGNKDTSQLPSKTVTYLTLPLPRIAVTSQVENSALALYLADKPAWLIVDPASPRVPERVARHVVARFDEGAFGPPVTEEWETVSREIAEYVRVRLFEGDSRRSRLVER